MNRRSTHTRIASVLLLGSPFTPAVMAESSSRDTLVGVAITKHIDVPYDDDRLQRLDAYLVDSTLPAPVLIEIHGGGFRSGSKSSGESGENRFFHRDGVYMRALKAGISVVSIDYRLAPKHKFPAQTDDAARAVQFVRAKAREWNIDPTRIALCGSSAGGHLALWVGLHDDLADPLNADPVTRESTRVRCIVAMSAPVDLARFDPDDLSGSRKGLANVLTDFLGCDADEYHRKPECIERVRRASPIHLVSSDDPPVMLVYPNRTGRPTGQLPARLDNPHSAWFGVQMGQQLTKHKVAHEELIGRRTSRSREASKIVDFLLAHLKGDTPRSE